VSLITRTYGLKPVATEVYPRTQDTASYAVAVVKTNSGINRLEDLRNKRSCHTGFGRTVGWNFPVFALSERQLIYPERCRFGKAVGQFFQQSCVPGAKEFINDVFRDNPISLCGLCRGNPQLRKLQIPSASLGRTGVDDLRSFFFCYFRTHQPESVVALPTRTRRSLPTSRARSTVWSKEAATWHSFDTRLRSKILVSVTLMTEICCAGCQTNEFVHQNINPSKTAETSSIHGPSVSVPAASACCAATEASDPSTNTKIAIWAVYLHPKYVPPLQTSKFPQLRSGNEEGGAADTNFLQLMSLYFSLL
jgi:Transferrin